MKIVGGTTPSRSPAAVDPLRVRFGTFELDEANASLLRDGKAVAVAPTPFAVLCALARRPGSLLSKHALLDEVWAPVRQRIGVEDRDQRAAHGAR